MDFDWRKTLSVVAPTLAAALGGPMSGMAVNMLVKALGLDPDAAQHEFTTPEKLISGAVERGDPGDLAKLKEVERDFLIELERLGIEKEKLAVQDRGNARAREIATGDLTPRRLAYITLAGFFAVLASQLMFAWEGKEISEAIQRTLDITTGILFAMVLAIKDYFFGSSSGQDRSIELQAGRS